MFLTTEIFLDKKEVGKKMDVKLAVVLGLFLVFVTVKCDVRHSSATKTCEGASSATGGSLEQMVGSVLYKTHSGYHQH